MACRHCNRRKGNRARGLCRCCEGTPGVKDLYPTPKAKYGRRGTRKDRAGGRDILPAEATDAMPGTAAKIAVMARRAERGESLFHPRDAFQPPGAGRRKVCRLWLKPNTK